MKGHGEGLTDVAFSHDGRSLATASTDGTARIWDVKSATQQKILAGHNGSVDSVSFSPNDRYVLTASFHDRTVRLWVAQAGQQIALLAGPDDPTNVVPAFTRANFNSDGTRVAIASADQAARVVRVFPTSQNLIDFARKVVVRELTPCERQRFFLPVEAGARECAN